ncbi:hypothetical protein ACOCJ4_05760 [Knoellia sp. CPCC 206435]|uniref:hypothetical protein n=1 Tax=Knoellia terrae TaxID=3404797 RepID=UPI003B437666
MAVGGFTALLITPAFALSYFTAYAVPGESPRPWLAVLQNPLANAGLLEPGSISVYDSYGVLYLAAWVLALAGSVTLVRSQFGRAAPWLRRAWVGALGCLALVAVGILGDYAIPSDVVGSVGFVLTGLGFVGATVAFAFLGFALRRYIGASWWVAWSVAALGVVSVFGGMVLVGHVPSGPGSGFAVAAMVVAASHRASRVASVTT